MQDSVTLKKAQVDVAASKINKFAFPQPHLTTQNFMEFYPSFAREIVSKSHGTLKETTFFRAEPLDKPCLGSAQMHKRAFFVPFRTVWEPFNDFYNDVPHNTDDGTIILNVCPRILMKTFVDFFINARCSVQVTDSDLITKGVFDFSQNGVYYNFTPFGRYAMKLFMSLGYSIIFNYSYDVKSPSALPLLCCCKVFMDYYFPNQYAHYGIYASLDGYMHHQDYFELTVDNLFKIVSAIRYVAYDDFFSGCWDNPVGPNSGVGSVDFFVTDPTASFVPYASSAPVSGEIKQSNNGTPYLTLAMERYGTNNFSVSNLTQYGDSMLKALTSYVRRHALAGSRALERNLAEFGVVLSADKLKRCYHLGDASFPFQIGDVMSTSDTSAGGGASLGAYAGKGFGFGDLKFEFENDEFGYLFIFSTIVPDVDYAQGLDRNTLHTFKTDFLIGEFDALGPSAVSRAEILVDMQGSLYNQGIDDALFGYAPRYFEYKKPYARFTGDFCYNSINADLNGWSTMRLFNPRDYGQGGALLTHNLDFVLGGDAVQYDRIFLGYSDENVDPFRVVHRQELEMYSPMRHLYDDVLLEDCSDGNQKISLEPNGVKMN